MSHVVQLSSVPATPLLAVRRQAARHELAEVIPEACGVVWDLIRASSISSHGRNVVVYLDDDGALAVGVEVGTDVTSSPDEACTLTSTPSGLVASTTHLGPYSGLPEAHQAVREWCRANRRRLVGPSWEVYGHWSDDPDSLRTDVHYLIEEDAGAES